MNRDQEEQRRITRLALGAVGDDAGFVLAGSGAIREHGLIDRPTEDVDLFTVEQARARFRTSLDRIVAALRAEGYTVEIRRRQDRFAQLTVVGAQGRITGLRPDGRPARRCEEALHTVGCATTRTVWTFKGRAFASQLNLSRELSAAAVGSDRMIGQRFTAVGKPRSRPCLWPWNPGNRPPCVQRVDCCGTTMRRRSILRTPPRIAGCSLPWSQGKSSAIPTSRHTTVCSAPGGQSQSLTSTRLIPALALGVSPMRCTDSRRSRSVRMSTVSAIYSSRRLGRAYSSMPTGRLPACAPTPCRRSSRGFRR